VGAESLKKTIILGGVVFAALVVLLYRWIIRMGRAKD